MSNEIKVGSVVRLKSGGIDMTVTGVGAESAHCRWFSSSGYDSGFGFGRQLSLLDQEFPLACLELKELADARFKAEAEALTHRASEMTALRKSRDHAIAARDTLQGKLDATEGERNHLFGKVEDLKELVKKLEVEAGSLANACAEPYPAPHDTKVHGPCPLCGQTDVGQQGEYDCAICGLPTTWDKQYEGTTLPSNATLIQNGGPGRQVLGKAPRPLDARRVVRANGGDS